jgi:TetR/AcrR family transcriptional regulator, mexJK operon transcriptional repressor
VSRTANVLRPAGPPAVPRGERRRREIVAVAEQVFLNRGFAATTMLTVAAEAGASKETLYRHFRSKEDLFAEVVSNRAQQMRAKLDADFDRPNAMSDVLKDLGTRLLTHMSRPDMVCLLRMVIAEVPRNPGIGRIFFDNGPEQTRLRLSAYLTAARERGEFVGTDPALAATVFLSAALGSQHLLRLTISEPPPLSADEIARRVDEIVAVFMNHYGRAHTAVQRA